MASFTIRDAGLERELEEKVHSDAETRAKFALFVDEVVEVAKGFAPSPGSGHPYATGEFVDSIQKRRIQNRVAGRFAKGWAWQVYSDDDKANLLEYGTSVDVNGVGVWQDLKGKWHKSPNTPTPEFATFAKTAAFFRGTAP